ncbi:hypothetical protein QBC42DRAFT_332598 [Cladorrhinum samala]|uniref:F-box domain-containing protein n=1 Tax=Cladorrhinum samala TaxID=585594 RepID=A0AAV9HLX5_9PEZI|nr:hypothetical protein QBC42DRAFT_332598 [Cladorrhinum samala]
MPKKTKPADAIANDDAAAAAEDVLVDLTQPIEKKSKKTKRQEMRMQKKRPPFKPRQFSDLDCDVMLCVLEFCVPTAIWALSKVCRGFRELIAANEQYIADRIIAFRYPNISRCFRLPVLVTQLDSSAIRDEFGDIERSLDIFKREILPKRIQLRHIPKHLSKVTCSCTSCVDRWNMLCLAVDFAHWQDDLDRGKPMPAHKWGVKPAWERQLRARYRQKVIAALHRPLLYAMILESHLDSTVRAIRRQRQNKANQLRHFPITPADARSGTDAFLANEGPSSADIPFSRDTYYMLEVFMPGRAWDGDEKKWLYMAVKHELDLRYVVAQVKAFEVVDKQISEINRQLSR